MQHRTDGRAAGHDPFFVGYLATPPGLSRFLLALGFCAVAAVAAGATLVALAQRDPGAGTWHDDTNTFDGVLHNIPYPLLRMNAGPDAQTLLLVEQGKRGVAGRFNGFDNRLVRVRGQLLERGELKLLELADVSDPVQPLEAMPRAPATNGSTSASKGARSVRGEIVDPKCFAGAMKPGDGKTHKACAALCLKGGIPPVLIERGDHGPGVYHVLTGRSGGPLSEPELARVIAVVGEPVEVEGVVQTREGLSLLKAHLDTLRRR